MHPPEPPELQPPPKPFTGVEVLSLLRENHWLMEPPAPALAEWAERAASLLGHYAEDRAALTGILRLVFEFDATQIMQLTESHVVLARYAARDVIRHLALHLLEPVPITSDRFKALIIALREELQVSSRDLFHPIRLALTGRSGEGELDRIILLLDEAAGLAFTVPVKSTHQRILEFCAAME